MRGFQAILKNLKILLIKNCILTEKANFTFSLGKEK